MEIPTTTINPSAPHTHTIVFLHGRGDNVQNFIRSLAESRDSNARTLADALPSFRWVFPQAPTRTCATSPDRWPQWFDVWNVTNFADREELQAEGLKEVVPEICKILTREAEVLGSKEAPAWDKIVLAGISMGAATGCHVLFNLNAPRLGAFIGFSCRCPFVGRTLQQMREVLALDDVPEHDQVLRNTPILLEHCVDDPLVKVENGRLMTEMLTSFGANVARREYPDGGHWFNSPAGMDDVIAFLNHVYSA
ncbi:phospholipase/carboxylesterase family protein [Sarocladium strictum]